MVRDVHDVDGTLPHHLQQVDPAVDEEEAEASVRVQRRSIMLN